MWAPPCQRCSKASWTLLCATCRKHLKLKNCRLCEGRPPDPQKPGKCSQCVGSIDEFYIPLRADRSLLDWLGRIKAQFLPELYREFPWDLFSELSSYDALVPIPSDPQKDRQRLFSPALELARVLQKKSGLKIPIVEALGRKPFLKNEKEMKREERLALMPKLFYLSHPLPPNFSRLLLVDDIMTTGASAEICARLLKPAAQKIGFLALARR